MNRSHALTGTVFVNCRAFEFFDGDTVGSCMLRANILSIRRSRSGEQRGMYCGIGICNDCLVTLDDVANVRACITLARDGMRVEIQEARA